MRIPATEIEAAVRDRVAALFDDGLALIATAWLNVPPPNIRALVERCADIAPRSRATIRDLVAQVRVHDSRIEIDCSTRAIAKLLHAEREDDAPEVITLQSRVRLTRSGRAMRLVQNNRAPASPAPNLAMIKALVKARRWWSDLKHGDIDINQLAIRDGVNGSYITRVLRLAFLAPDVVDAILIGKLLPEVTVLTLTATDAVQQGWAEQRRRLLPV